MKKRISLFLLAAMLLTMAACGNTSGNSGSIADASTPPDSSSSNGGYTWTQDYVWKFTHEGAAGMGEDHLATTFAKLINERSDGHIKVNIFDFNQLGSGADQFELIQNGSIEFGIASSGAVASLVPEAGIFGLHYIYPAEPSGMWDFLAASETVAMLSDIMYDNGFKVFSWNIEGPHIWSMKKPINSVSDMNGLKFRTQANQLEMASFKAYGANPTTVAFAELYSALQLGTVDGQQQTALGNNIMNYFDVAPYYVEAHASYYVDAPVCNASFYESLDPYVQDLLIECMLEARSSLEAFLEEEDNVNARQVAAEKNVTWIEFTEQQQAEFAEKSVEAREMFLEIGGSRAQEVLDGILTELGKA